MVDAEINIAIKIMKYESNSRLFEHMKVKYTHALHLLSLETYLTKQTLIL